MVQRLKLCPSTLGATDSIPGWGTKIPYAVWCGQKLESKLKKKKIVSVTTVIFRNDPRKRGNPDVSEIKHYNLSRTKA